MPSPFPGMDPYLEDPLHWSGVHIKLITAIGDELVAQLRPRYVVATEERVYVSRDNDPGRSVLVPDVQIVGGQYGAKRPRTTSTWEDSDVAVAEPIDVITFIDEEISEKYINIVDVRDQRVVTTIEVLSPTNKVPNSEGRLSYMAKRRQVMESGVNLVEIDLLRAGERIPNGNGFIDCDYMVHVSRTGKRPRGQIWPIMLRERLPVIPVPLKTEDADAKLDLQALVSLIYDRGGYDYSLNYRKDPSPKLTRQHATWASKFLKLPASIKNKKSGG